MSHDTPRRTAQVDHLIIGAGFAGLCAAIKLQEAGETDFVVIEKGTDVGGTWRDNTYPGAACDVPSQLYSYSFAPNPDWSRSFSPQPEIQAYIKRVAERSGTLDRFVFDTAVDDATWDDAAQRWVVQHDRRHVRRPHRDQRRRRPLRAEAARDRGHRDLPGRDVPLRPLEPRRRPDRQAGRRDRHRRLGDPDRPGDPEDRSATSTSTSAPRRTSCRATTGPTPARAGRVQADARACSGSTATGDLLGPRVLRAGLHAAAQAGLAGQAAGAEEHRNAASRTPSCARRSPRPSRSAASGS